jgi:hypothetical protein
MSLTRHECCALPPPLWGRVGEGGNSEAVHLRPPLFELRSNIPRRKGVAIAYGEIGRFFFLPSAISARTPVARMSAATCGTAPGCRQRPRIRATDGSSGLRVLPLIICDCAARKEGSRSRTLCEIA